jgi:hypothetical protein
VSLDAVIMSDRSYKDAKRPMPWFHKDQTTHDGRRTEHLFLICPNTWKNIGKHAPLISNSSDEDSRYVAIIRRRLTSDDALPRFKMCGFAFVFQCLNESSVAHHQPKL